MFIGIIVLPNILDVNVYEFDVWMSVTQSYCNFWTVADIWNVDSNL